MEKHPEQQVGRYAIFDQLAAGGMATVHIARLIGREGFSRVVAAKRMHRHFQENAEFNRMFLEEARLAARVRHPNVVPIVDVLSHGNELIIVMEYVHGESLLALMRLAEGEPLPIPVACAIMTGALQGLHAAHEARNERGEPLGIVHRDVSPHNILVGADGVARVVDFGVAKAVHAQDETKPGVLKGKFSYMAPEVIRGAPSTRQADVFSAATVLWELLAGRKLFAGTTDQERLLAIVEGGYPSPRAFNPNVSPRLERIVAKALLLDTNVRYGSALEFAIDIEREVPLASQRVVGEWVQSRAGKELERRASLLHQIETSTIGPISSRAELMPHGTFGGSPSEQMSAVTSQSVPEARRRFGSSTILAAVGLAAALGAVLTFFAQRQHADEPREPAAVVQQSAAVVPVVPPAPSSAALSVESAQPAPVAPPAVSASAASPTPAPSAEPLAVPSATQVVTRWSAPRPTPVKPVPRSKVHGKPFLPNEL